MPAVPKGASHTLSPLASSAQELVRRGQEQEWDGDVHSAVLQRCSEHRPQLVAVGATVHSTTAAVRHDAGHPAEPGFAFWLPLSQEALGMRVAVGFYCPAYLSHRSVRDEPDHRQLEAAAHAVAVYNPRREKYCGHALVSPEHLGVPC